MSRHCCNVAEMCTNVVTCLLDVLKENTTGILKEYESSLLTIAFNLSNKFSPAGVYSQCLCYGYVILLPPCT